MGQNHWGNGFVLLNSAIPTADGGYLLAGFSYSDASGDKSENSKGGSDYWIVKLQDLTTSVVTNFTAVNAETEQKVNDFIPQAAVRQVEVYPVPTLDVLNILHARAGEEAYLVLLDFRGKGLRLQPLRQQSVEQVDLSGFQKVICYLRIVSAQGVQVIRVAKE